MAVKLADAFIALGIDDRDLDRGFNAARNKVRGFLSDITTGIGQGIGQAVFNNIGRLIDASLDQLGKATQSANSLNESIIRSQRVFGDSAQEIRAWAQEADTALGLSESAALANASALGTMLVQMGVSRERASDMSQQMIETAADLAAFNGDASQTARVLETMAAGFRGEYDSLQRFLPAITDAAIKQQALAETGKENEEQLTAQEKALATYTLIQQGATIAQGAYADAVERGAAAQTEFAARAENMRAEIGQVGLIIQQEFFRALNLLLEDMGFYGESIIDQLVIGLTKGLTAVTPFLADLRAFFAYWLKPSSPPRLFRDIREWGRDTLKEYFHHWSDPDIGAFRNLGNAIENVLRSAVGAGRLRETDLVSRVFGSVRELSHAIEEWRIAGSISVQTMDRIRRAAGPAGESVSDLVNSYFNLQAATRETVEAQERLNNVTRKYDEALRPINEKLDANARAQQKIRDAQRLEELGDIISDRTADIEDRQLARLEQEEILLRQQADALEREAETAVDAEQKKVDATEQERLAKQAVFDQTQALIEQQVKNNQLIAESIALTERLANEALAAEEKARRELEAQRRKEEAELERLEGAQLRYRLQLADTEGDLAIMREELAKVTEGSAEYFDILTEIVRLEEKLADERAGQGGGDVLTILEDTGKKAEETKQIYEDLRLALRGAFDTLFGTDGSIPQEPSPFWKNVADQISNIGTVAGEVIPVIQKMVDFFFLRDQSDFANQLFLPSIGGGTGTGTSDTSIMGRIYNMVITAITNLRLLAQGDWRTVWQNFREVAEEELKEDILSGNKEGQFLWEQVIEVADLIEALSEGRWRDAWEIFTEPPREFIQGLIDKINEFLGLEEALQNFMERFGFPTNPFDPNLAPGQDVLPPSPYSSFPGVTPETVIPASLGGFGTTNNATTNITLGPFNISLPVVAGTPESAGQAFARSVDDELRALGWSPT